MLRRPKHSTIEVVTPKQEEKQSGMFNFKMTLVIERQEF
jgi:hypothetical protein